MRYRCHRSRQYFHFLRKTPVLARINNRKILTGLLEALDLTSYSVDIYSIIDHSEKVPVEKTTENLAEIGLSEENIKKILAFINLHDERSFVVKNLGNLGIDNPTFTEGVSELDQVLYLLETMGLKDQIIADMKIVRGLDYYTGTVFEFILPEHKSIGSVCGGGRYENLTGYFTDQKFPGVGGSIGLTRLFYVLNEEQLLPEQSANPIDYAIIPISENELDFSFQVADKLRVRGSSVTVVLTDKKLGDKLTYAAKLAKNGIVIGESEAASGSFKVKNFTTGETTDLNLDA